MPFSLELRRRIYRYRQLREKKGIKGEFLPVGFEGTRREKRNSTTSLYVLRDHLGFAALRLVRAGHTFATNWLRHGGDIVRLSSVLGWAHADHDDAAATSRPA